MAASEPLSPVDEAEKQGIAAEENPWRVAWRRMYKDKVAFVAMVGLALMLLAAMIGPVNLGLPHEDLQTLRDRLQPPAWSEGGSMKHLLGTDHLGRDMLSRLIAGLRATFVVALSATALGCVIGSTLGLVGGFIGGRIDDLVMRLTEVQLAFPALLMAMLLVTVMNPSKTTLILALGLNGWMLYSRMMRSQVLTIRESTYVEASISLGNTRWGTLWRHILPNALPALISLVILELARLALAEASLSFLGYGVQPPEVSLGTMLSDGRQLLIKSWWMAGFPGLAIAGMVLMLNLVANRLKEILDPNQR